MAVTHHTSPSRATTRLHEAARWLTLAGLLGLTVMLLWHTTGDLDLLLHDRVGQDILDGQGIPDTNGFSFTAPDHRWVDHEWAFQVLVAAAGNLSRAADAVDRDAGWHWLRLALGLSLVTVLLGDQRWGRNAGAGLLGLVGLMVLALLWTRLTLRPELVSAIMLVLVTNRVEAQLRDRSTAPRWRVMLDPRRSGGQATWLTLIWYQCHGFAILSVVIWLLAGLLDRGAAPTPQRWRRAGLGALFALLAGLATPNGLAGLVYPLRALAQFTGDQPDWRRTISELVPLLETRGALAMTLVMFKVSLVWSALWLVATWPRRSWLRIALFMLALAAAWQGQRNLGLYAVALAMLHGGPTTTAPLPWPRFRSRLNRIAPVVSLATAPVVWAVTGLWCAALLTSQFYLNEGVARRTGAGLTPAVYPLTQARLLAAWPGVRVANTVDAASSLIHARAGQISIDGRTEAYPTSAWRQYLEFKSGGAATGRQLQIWRPGAVCLAHRNPASHAIIRTLATDPAWTVASADAAGILFLPVDQRPQNLDLGAWRHSARRLRDRLGANADVRQVDEAVAWAGLLTLLGDNALGEDLLIRAERARPRHPVVAHNLGNLLLARQDFTGALRRFETAARLNRRAAPPLVNAGNCLFNLQRIQDAADAFEAAVRRDPANFEAWANLAEVRRHSGDRDGAGEAYRRALELRPGDERLRQRARAL